MLHTVKTRGEIRPHHTISLTVPDDLPPGPLMVTITSAVASPNEYSTLGDLLDSGFVGRWADRKDLPNNDAEFSSWRRNNWNRNRP